MGFSYSFCFMGAAPFPLWETTALQTGAPILHSHLFPSLACFTDWLWTGRQTPFPESLETESEPRLDACLRNLTSQRPALRPRPTRPRRPQPRNLPRSQRRPRDRYSLTLRPPRGAGRRDAVSGGEWPDGAWRSGGARARACPRAAASRVCPSSSRPGAAGHAGKGGVPGGGEGGLE